MAAPSVASGYTSIATTTANGQADSLDTTMTSTYGVTERTPGLQSVGGTDPTDKIYAVSSATGGGSDTLYGCGFDINSKLGGNLDCDGNGRLVLCHGTAHRAGGSLSRGNTVANGGFRIALQSGTGYRVWYVGGSDQTDFWPIAQIFAIVIDPNSTTYVDSGGTFDPANIDFITYIFDRTASDGLASSAYVGPVGYLDAHVLTGGESGDRGSFSDFFDKAQSLSPPTLDISRFADGSIACVSKLQVGNGSTLTEFEDSDITVSFRAQPDVSATEQTAHWVDSGLGFSANLSASCVLNLSGVTFTSPSRYDFSITSVSGSTITLTSCLFRNAAPTISDESVLSSCTFVGCGEIDATDGAPTLTDVIVDGGTDTRGLSIDDTSNVTGLTVRNCTTGIHVSGTGPQSITLDGTNFSNNTTDLEWSGTGVLTVNLTGGADTPSTSATGGGSVTIAPLTVDLTLSGMVEGSKYIISRDSDGSDLLSGTATSSGTAAGTYSYTSNVDVTISVECWDATYGRYKPVRLSGTITSSGLTQPIAQVEAVEDIDYKTDSVTDWTYTVGATSTIEETGDGDQVHVLALVNFCNSQRYSTGVTEIYRDYPFNTLTDTLVEMRQGTDFGASDDHNYLKGAGINNLKSGGNDIYTRIEFNGTLESGTQIYCLQDGSELTSWWGTGNVDILVKVRNGGTLIDSGTVAFFAREFGDTYDFVSVSAASGGSITVGLNTEDDPDVTISAATAATYTDILTDDSGPYSVDLENGDGANDYDVRIDEDDTARSIVYQVLQYRLRRGETTTINGTAGQFYRRAGASYTANDATPLLAKVGTNYLYRRGVVPINASTADLNNWQTIDSSGDTQVPPTQAAITAQAIESGDRLAAWRKKSYASATGNNSGDGDVVVKTTIDSAVPSSGNLVISGVLYAYTSYTSATFTLAGTLASTIAEDTEVYVPYPDKTQFSLAAGNNSGNGTLVVKETIPLDTPDSGVVRVDDGDPYPYSSYSGSTFTLDSVTLDESYDEDDAAWVGYIDTTATGTSESVTVKYQEDVPVIFYARDYGQQPFFAEGVFTSSGLTFTASMEDDDQATATAISRTFTFDPTTFSTLGYGRIIDDASEDEVDIEFPKQALYDQIRLFEESDYGIIYPSIVTGSGAVTLSPPGASTPIATGVTCTLSDKWTLKFAGGTYVVDLTGPNLTGGPGGRPIEAFIGQPQVQNNNQQYGTQVIATADFDDDDRTTLNAISSAVTTIDSNVDTANSSLTTIDGKVDTLTTNVATVDSVADSIETKVDTLTTNVATVDSVVDSIETKTDTLTTNLATTDGKVDTAIADIATVDGIVDSIASTTSTTDGKVDTLTTNLATVEGKVDTVDTVADGIASALTATDAVVDATATKVDELHAIRGLTSGTPTTKTPTGETAGGITLTYTEDGDDVTVERA